MILSIFIKRMIVIVVFLGIVFGSLFLTYEKWANYRDNRKAKKHFYSKQYAEALLFLKDLPDKKEIKSKKQLEIGYLRAMSYQKINKIKDAENYWKKIQQNTKYKEYKDEAYYYLGLNSWNSTDYDSAFDLFMKNIEHFPESSYTGDSIYYLALLYSEKGDIFKARDMFEKVVSKYTDAQNVEASYDKLGELNIKLLFSKKETPISEIYVVKPGDSLAVIAKKFNTTVYLLKGSNQLKTHNIKPFDRLKVIKSKFSLMIDKSQNVLFLKIDGKFFKRYFVGTGKENSTPVGIFKIVEKLVNPTWYHPDGGVVPFGSKDNFLGTRWMSIDSPGYGIHGTWEPDSVGKQSSMGCIRLKNKEVEELYKIVPVGTEVKIVD
ncbi:MAG: L,D-transpeptidase family protein [Candidatus Aureabacteria bacterium]|nr:L,D-transpeptidase family protein [Candidatus Auribacterota bacterium]